MSGSDPSDPSNPLSSSESSLAEPPPESIPEQRPGKAGGKRDQNRRARVAQLTEAATALFLEQGIEPTTIDDIVKAAGVAKGSFYRYFESKPHLVEHLFAPVREEADTALASCGQALEGASTFEAMMEVYRDLGAELAGTLLRYDEIVLLYLMESRGPATPARAPICQLSDLIRDRAVELTHVAHQHGILKPIPPTLSALAVVGMVERLVLGLLKAEPGFSEDDGFDPLTVPEALAGLVLDGLLQRS